MPFMVSVNRWILRLGMPLVLMSYIAYIAYEATRFEDLGRRVIAETHRHWISESPSINALILGGSNAHFSLSAELLSQRTGKVWYNASLLNEGYSDVGYGNYVRSMFKKAEAAQIEMVVYSPISAFRKGLSERREQYFGPVYGHANLGIRPQKSLYDFLSTAKPSALPKPVKIYPPPNRFGDLKFENFECGGKPELNFIVEREGEDSSAKIIVKNVLNYMAAFPNADVYMVFPSEYYLNFDEQYLVAYNNSVSTAVGSIILNTAPDLARRLHFLTQPTYPDASFVCDSRHHANAIGRLWRTEDLASRL